MPIIQVSNSRRLDSRENKPHIFFPILYNILTSHISCCSVCLGTALEKNGVGEKPSVLILCLEVLRKDESGAVLPNILRTPPEIQ